jgi:cell division protein FtsW
MSEQSNTKSIFSPSLFSVSGNLVHKTKGDKVIWAVVLLLTVASLLLVYSSTGSLAYKMSKSNESYLFKQLAFIISGICIIYIAHRVNYTYYSKLATLFFLISIAMLIYTMFFGVQLNSGTRWVKVPVINMTLQTSDVAKLALFIYMSRMLSRKQNVIKDFKKGFLPIIIPVVLVCLLVAPSNLSTSILIAGTSFILMFIGRINIKHLGITALIAASVLALLVSIAIAYYDKEKGETADLPAVLSVGRVPTWISRIQTFWYGEKSMESEKSYQVNQAKIAITKGGIFCKGPGNSEQRNFLPHSYSDFIYAIIIEEYGLVGGALMVFIYLLFLYRCIRVFKKCPYAFGAFLALALSFTLVIQAMVNMSVNVSLFPNTGVTLPLVSMGGSSFIFTCLSIGIILSVARNVEQLEGQKSSDQTLTTQQVEEPA